jgi:hypothetical protein
MCMATYKKHIEWFQELKYQTFRKRKMNYVNDEGYCKDYLSVWLYSNVSFDL